MRLPGPPASSATTTILKPLNETQRRRNAKGTKLNLPPRNAYATPTAVSKGALRTIAYRRNAEVDVLNKSTPTQRLPTPPNADGTNPKAANRPQRRSGGAGGKGPRAVGYDANGIILCRRNADGKQRTDRNVAGGRRGRAREGGGGWNELVEPQRGGQGGVDWLHQSCGRLRLVGVALRGDLLSKSPSALSVRCVGVESALPVKTIANATGFYRIRPGAPRDHTEAPRATLRSVRRFGFRCVGVGRRWEALRLR